jgi:dimethylamine/trimethylamine dehydrogenase
LPVLTPDDLMAGKRPEGGHVAIFDDDHYYMGGALAELLVSEGRRVTLVTPSARVSEWTDHTMEQERIQGRLMELGVELLTSKGLLRGDAGGVRLGCAYTGRRSELECDALLLVTSRLPNDDLAQSLARSGASVRAVGDAYSPGTIAAAVWDGRRYAEELDAEPADPDDSPFLREVTELSPERVRGSVT